MDIDSFQNSSVTQKEILLKKAYEDFLKDLKAIEKKRDDQILALLKAIDDVKLEDARADIKNVK